MHFRLNYFGFKIQDLQLWQLLMYTQITNIARLYIVIEILCLSQIVAAKYSLFGTKWCHVRIECS